MKFKNFEFRIVLQVLFLVATILAFSFFILKPLFLFAALISPLIIYQVIALIKFQKKAQEEVTQFVESGLMFTINSAEISESYKKDLSGAADVFNKYPETNIVIEGHTDDTGTDEINMALSEKRAIAVKDYLVSKGVSAGRLTSQWYGETQPRYPNDSEANRQKNRRVELAVVANEKMKEDAKDGKLD